MPAPDETTARIAYANNCVALLYRFLGHGKGQITTVGGEFDIGDQFLRILPDKTGISRRVLIVDIRISYCRLLIVDKLPQYVTRIRTSRWLRRRSVGRRVGLSVLDSVAVYQRKSIGAGGAYHITIRRVHCSSAA